MGKVPALPLETRLPWSGRPDLTDDLCVPNRDRPPTAPRADRTRLVAGWRDRVRLAATTADRAMDARCWEEADADPLRVMHRASVHTGSVPSGSNWWQGSDDRTRAVAFYPRRSSWTPALAPLPGLRDTTLRVASHAQIGDQR